MDITKIKKAKRKLQMHGNENWDLDTILQESKNGHLYKKMGYQQAGKTKVINERLTLTFYEKKEAR